MTDKDILEQYLKDDAIYQYLYGGCRIAYRNSAAKTSDFAYYKLSIRFKEFGDSIASIFKRNK